MCNCNMVHADRRSGRIKKRALWGCRTWYAVSTLPTHSRERPRHAPPSVRSTSRLESRVSRAVCVRCRGPRAAGVGREYPARCRSFVAPGLGRPGTESAERRQRAAAERATTGGASSHKGVLPESECMKPPRNTKEPEMASTPSRTIRTAPRVTITSRAAARRGYVLRGTVRAEVSLCGGLSVMKGARARSEVTLICSVVAFCDAYASS